jgi:class 3 adenylate cyclase/tetratricopeptide (TPR) repeat protein
MRCVACGAEVPVGARFCPSCGTSLAAAGEERRVVTVLFADIVGFTRLAERRDPEQVKRLVDRCFERLARDVTAFGGVVDKVVGDALVALFGAPVAHEDDAERAVRAGLRMQAALAELAPEVGDAIELRIGVNTGEVLVGSTSAGGDYTAMGDVMNTAARLQSLAAPGQVLVGPATWAATRDAIAFRPAGALSARGREDPVEAWVAGATLRPPGMRTRRAAPFVGRHDESGTLLSAATLAVERQRAQLAVLVGEAGVGKSRLAQEVAAEVARRWDAEVLEGRCLPYGEANVWWPVAEVVRGALQLGADTPAPEAERALRRGLGDLLAPEQAAHLDRYVIGLMHALGYQTPLRGGDRDHNRSEVTLALTVAIEAQLRRRPLVLILSDVHWAAEAVWVLLDHLLGELARQRLVVLLTARDLEAVTVPVGRHGLVVLQLDPLGEDAARQLLAGAGAELPEPAVRALVRRSGGNPFFLEELAALVAGQPEPDRQLLVAQLADGQPGVLPDTLRGLVAARLDALPPDERALLDDAAVLGRAGPVGGLATLARERRGRTAIGAELAALAAKDLLVVDGTRYEFRSDLVRDVAYAMLTKTDRARMHTGIAEYLATHSGPVDELRSSMVVRIADHYRTAAGLVRELRFVPHVDPAEVERRALHWVDEAARRAAAASAHRDAERWFGVGADLAGDDAALARFLLGRAEARCATHDLVGSRADLERIEALGVGDPVLEARVLLVRGDLDRKAGDLDRASRRLRRAAARFEELGQPSDRALALRLVGLAELFRGRDEAALQAIEASREVAAAAGDRRAEAWALQNQAWHAFRTGQVSRARARLAEAGAMFVELDDRGGLAWVRGLEAWVAFHLGEWDEARALIAEVLPETRRRGDRWAEAVMLNLQASLELWSGRPSAASDLARQSIGVAGDIGNGPLGAQSRCTLGRALVTLGRAAEGTAVLEDAYRLADRSGDEESRRMATVANVASAARLGEPERAIRWAARLDRLDPDLDVVGGTDVVASLALALVQRGSLDGAATQVAPLLGAAEGAPVPSYALAVGSIVAAARGDRAEVERRAAGALRQRSTYLDRVFARLALAASSAAAGDPGRRDAELAAARAELAVTEDRITPLLVDLAAGVLGAGPLDEAEATLVALGMEPAAWRRVWALAAAAGAVEVRPGRRGRRPGGLSRGGP